MSRFLVKKFNKSTLIAFRQSCDDDRSDDFDVGSAWSSKRKNNRKQTNKTKKRKGYCNWQFKSDNYDDNEEGKKAQQMTPKKGSEHPQQKERQFVWCAFMCAIKSALWSMSQMLEKKRKNERKK